jgi:putative ABC transport system substrate-binding protein
VKRRDFLVLIATATAGWPPGASAEQPEFPVIGYLSPNSAESAARNLPSFHQGLSQVGFVEGRNVAIDYRLVPAEYERLPALAADLVSRKVAVIVATNINAALAAKAATSTIPIVFWVGVDPVASGLVASLNHPGGNLTGVNMLFGELWPKRLDLLHELVPKAAAVGVLINPANRNADVNTENLQPAARSLGSKSALLRASTESDIDAAFTMIEQSGLEALLVGDDPSFADRASQLTTLAARWRVPAIYFSRHFVAAGGLISYGPSPSFPARVAGEYAGRILRGAKPADLPVQQPTELELVVNLDTAKALGLTVPPAILARADEVIE